MGKKSGKRRTVRKEDTTDKVMAKNKNATTGTELAGARAASSTTSAPDVTPAAGARSAADVTPTAGARSSAGATSVSGATSAPGKSRQKKPCSVVLLALVFFAGVISTFLIQRITGHAGFQEKRSVSDESVSVGSVSQDSISSGSISMGSVSVGSISEGSTLLETILGGGVKEEPVPEPIVGVFSWHDLYVSDISIMEKYDVNQIYICFDEEVANGNYDLIRDCVKQLDDYEVYLLSGARDWGSTEMREVVDITKTIGGFDGIMLDVEPDDYTEEYAEDIEIVCEYADIPVLVCIPHWIDEEIVKRVIRACDGVAVMNYDLGHECENIEYMIEEADKAHTPIINIYELQPPGRYNLTEEKTYNGDMAAVLQNFREQFASAPQVGIAYHYIKYMQ